MAEPLFGAAFFIGILGNLIARHADPAARSIERAAYSLRGELEKPSLLDIALDHVTLARVALFEAILERADFSAISAELAAVDYAVTHLRSAADLSEIPRGLLSRAWLRFLQGRRTGEASAQEDLDEAWDNRGARSDAAVPRGSTVSLEPG